MKHLLPCENPSRLLVHCCGKKRFRACFYSVQECLCSGSVHEKSEVRWKERGHILQGSCNVSLVLKTTERKREAEREDVILLRLLVVVRLQKWVGCSWALREGKRRDVKQAVNGWLGTGDTVGTHCRGHTHTGSPDTCRSPGMGLETHLTQLRPHTACGYYTWRRKQTGGREARTEVSDKKWQVPL